ncbi:MAG TPA: Smr/MutS family protein, partial [Thermodesulfobacteriota bacterium]|nr:Smr/MutS family protein [Thermodesulfobacteriota bacterium]
AEAAERVNAFFRNGDFEAPNLRNRAEPLPRFREVFEHLRQTFGPRGEILDSASPELRRIRREISGVRSRIRRSLESLWERDDLGKIFQEQIITIRSERYVVAVKAEFKNALPGIIHDQSHSRATFFVEPLSTLEENNELNMLLQDEKEEERRILLDCTAEARQRAGDLNVAVEILGHLDLVSAKARWAQEFRAVKPSFSSDGSWRLRNARHPLIQPDAVPIDLRLDPGQSTLIISGANAGGKTAALKTLGLLTLIAQSGVPIPADGGSEVGVFGKIFADIGDEQSLEENLSTFSAWIQSVARILREADASSLVLMDEVGGGTDPVEGAALTMAIIDALRARGAKIVVTTHLHLLKAYGAVNPDVINVSVEFDPETLRPTFRLLYGRPGESHALLMGEKWGLPREIIRKAYEYMGEGERKVSQLVQEMEKTQHELEQRLKETETMKREAEDFRRRAEASLAESRKEETRMLTRAREETQSAVREARENLRELIRDFKARGRTDLHRLNEEISAEEKKIAEKTGPTGPPNGSRGSVSSQDPIRRLKEAISGKAAGGRRGAPVRMRGHVEYEIPSARREINIIGLRVEEALPVVDKALDEAFLGNLKELDVIHGAGTGRLRQAVRDHLRDHPLVKSYVPGGPGRGGDGATVVEVAPAPRRAERRAGKSGAHRG